MASDFVRVSSRHSPLSSEAKAIIKMFAIFSNHCDLVSLFVRIFMLLSCGFGHVSSKVKNSGLVDNGVKTEIIPFKTFYFQQWRSLNLD